MTQQHSRQDNRKRRRRIGVYAVATALAVCAGIGLAALAAQSEPAVAVTAASAGRPAAAAPAVVSAPLGAASVPLSPFAKLNVAGPKRIAAEAAVPVPVPEAQRKAQLAEYEKMEMPADFVPASADGSTENAPFAHIRLAELSSGQHAIDLLGENLAPVANWYGMTATSLSQLLLGDASVHLDRKGRIVHIDEGVGASGATAEARTTAAATNTVAATPFPLDQTFKLHSKADSTRVLFLDFTGQGGHPAFDLDGIPSTFSAAERLLIQKVWQRVAEDYVAFDVDVTSEAPAAASGKIGATVLITPQASTAGGYAYLNSFTTFAANAAPAFCFPNNLANSEKPIGECVSHEAGHTLGLQHQGSATSAYYAGQGDGTTGWAPIMGVGYDKNLTQWAKGEYLGANNKEDAYAVMARQGLKPRADDHGNTPATATVLVGVSANGLFNLSASGIISTPSDADMFRFQAGAGPLSLKALGAALGANVDIALQLFDASGRLLASANPVAELSASLSVTLALSGTYYLSVKGVGNGDPLKTGYSNYGSVGQYSISGSSALPPTAAKVASASLR